MAAKKRISCDCGTIHVKVVESVKKSMPKNKDFCGLAELYRMFSGCTRIKILWALSQSSMCVCDLAVLMGMSKSAISHQLKSLRLTELVRFEKQGKVVYYFLADGHVKKILANGFSHIKEK